MKQLIYKGKARVFAPSFTLRYESTGEEENGLISVTHLSSGEILYYEPKEYKNLFKEITNQKS